MGGREGGLSEVKGAGKLLPQILEGKKQMYVSLLWPVVNHKVT